MGMMGPSNFEQSTPNNSATCRVSPRYRKTDDGLAVRSLSPFVFARASDKLMRHASNGNCPPRAPNVPVVTVIAPARADADRTERNEGLGLTEDIDGVVSAHIDVVGRHVHDGTERRQRPPPVALEHDP